MKGGLVVGACGAIGAAGCAMAAALVFVVTSSACSSASDHPAQQPCLDDACGVGVGPPGHPPITDAAETSAPDTTPQPLPTSCDAVTGNVAILIGSSDDPIFHGQEVVGGPIAGKFEVVTSTSDTVVVRATGDVDRLRLLFAFSSAKLSPAAPLAEGAYPDAQRYPTEATGTPGFDVTVEETTCPFASASFQILDVAVDPVDAHLLRISATFDRRCEGGGEMTGCLRYQSAIPPVDAGAPDAPPDASDAPDAGADSPESG